MSTVSDHLRRRRVRRNRALSSPSARLGRLSLVLAAFFSAGLGVLAILLAVAFNGLSRELPAVESLPALLSPGTGSLQEPTRIMDLSGEHVIRTLSNPSISEAGYIPIEDIPAWVISSTVAIADPDFWSNPGYRFESLLDGQADTISQKLASALLFWQEPPGVRRSVRERILAGQAISTYGREQVLEWYLNAADYGNSAFGIDAAARLYFDVPTAELSLAQAVLLAAVSEAPDLNPFNSPEVARQRARELIQRLLSDSAISPDEAARALADPLSVSAPASVQLDPSDAFVEALLAELDREIPRRRLERGGFEIISTLDYELQMQIACVLGEQLERLAGFDPADLPTDCPAARLLPVLPTSIEGWAAVGGEVVVIDPLSGQVRALASIDGGSASSTSLVNHPPGSVLIPLVYLSAFTRGFGPASLVWDIPANLPGDLPAGINLPPDPDGRYHGPLRMRTALANGYLTPALQLLAQLGPENVWRTADQAGLDGLENLGGSAAQNLLLEGGGLSLLELTHTFGIFSTLGVLIGRPAVKPTSPAAGVVDGSSAGPVPLQPTTVVRVLDTAGRNQIPPPEAQSRPVTSAQLAYLLTDVLSDEAARWASLGHPNPLEIGRPAGAAVGRTADGRNVWALGFTPRLSLGVWIGLPAEEASAPLSSAAAAGVWHAAIQHAVEDLPAEGWTPPPGISRVVVCDPSGLLPTAECPTTVSEIFSAGSEPTQPDTLFRRFEINRETGLLATIFTPPALVETRVYLVPPSEAVSWAAQAGLPIPPENYDLVTQPPLSNPDVNLTSPAMFASVRGRVVIRGTAAGQDFSTYRVQVGQGINPQEWIQLGEDAVLPASDAVLAVWDTGDLNGLYAIRLLVVRGNQRLDVAILQVTVDNRPPQVEITYPIEGQIFLYPRDRRMTIQIVAADDLALERVEVYLDEDFVGALTRAPFALPWDLLPGVHILRVTAVDRAGNTSEHSIEFVVNR